MQTQSLFTETAKNLIRTMGHKDLIRYLRKRLDDGRDLPSRPAIVKALSLLDENVSLEFLCSLAHDDSEKSETRISALQSVRRSAAGLLHPAGSVLPNLSRLVGNDSQDIRSEAVITLIRVGLEQTALKAWHTLRYPILNVSAQRELDNVPALNSDEVEERVRLKEGLVQRPAELSIIERKLKAVGIVALFGQAGIGKTVLARQFMDMKRHQYQYRIWVSAPRNVEALVAAITDGLGEVRRSPVGPFHHALVALLKGKYVLIVIDDFEKSEEGSEVALFAEHLAGVVDVHFVIVGRISPVVSGKTHGVLIEPLTYDQSKVLLGNSLPPLARHLSADVERAIIRQSEGNPLFLKLIAERVGRTGDAENALRDVAKGGDVNDILESTVGRLNPRELRLLQILSQFDPPIEMRIVREIAERELGSDDDVRKALGSLSDLHLISLDERGGVRFAHQLIRDYAQKMTDARTAARVKSELAADSDHR